MELPFCFWLPSTWRWWVEHSEDSAPLKGRYDFDQAYNGGNSLAFEGDLKANSSQNVSTLFDQDSCDRNDKN